jgi:predicted RNA binding protein YcfA (HicA-like mRNA interferase family)
MSPRLPRDVSGVELSRLLEEFGYVVTRQKGSHLRLTTQERGEHYLTVPNHDSLVDGAAVSDSPRFPHIIGKSPEQIP